MVKRQRDVFWGSFRFNKRRENYFQSVKISWPVTVVHWKRNGQRSKSDEQFWKHKNQEKSRIWGPALMTQGERLNSEDDCTNPSKVCSICFCMTFQNRLSQITTRRTRFCEEIWLLPAGTIDNGDAFASTDRLAEKSIHRRAPKERNAFNINTAWQFKASTPPTGNKWLAAVKVKPFTCHTVARHTSIWALRVF